MRLSRGWCRLLQFWTGVASLCGIGVGTLQILGPLPETMPQALYINLAAMEFPRQASDGSLAVSPAILDPKVDLSGEPISDVRQVTEPLIAVSMATMLLTDRGTPPPEFVESDKPTSDVIEPVSESDDAAQQKAAPSGKKLRLRIVRDHERCPIKTCYKWRLIESRKKFPSGTTIDLARLRLAPHLREATEKGTIELIIEAIDQHKKINGRDTVIFIATDLTGVAPSEALP